MLAGGSMTSPLDLLDAQAATLVRFAALPSLILTREDRDAFLAGAKALEREARARRTGGA
jgi:hypothetical protein